MFGTVLWGFLFQYFLLINASGQIKDSLNGPSFDETKEIGVLPKFEVKINTDKYVYADDNLIEVTIWAKYPDGKPVKGKTTVILEGIPGDFETLLQRQEKIIDVDGAVHMEFSPLLEPFAIKSHTYSSPLKMFVIVTEKLTGNRQNASTTVHLIFN